MKATAQDSLIKTIEPLLAAIGATLIDPDHIKPGDVPLESNGVVIAAVRLPAVARRTRSDDRIGRTRTRRQTFRSLAHRETTRDSTS